MVVEPGGQDTFRDAEFLTPFGERVRLAVIGNEAGAIVMPTGALQILLYVKRFIGALTHKLMGALSMDALGKVAVHAKYLKAIWVFLAMHPMKHIRMLLSHLASVFSTIVVDVIERKKLNRILTATGALEVAARVMQEGTEPDLAVVLQSCLARALGVCLAIRSYPFLDALLALGAVQDRTIFSRPFFVKLGHGQRLFAGLAGFGIHVDIVPQGPRIVKS